MSFNNNSGFAQSKRPDRTLVDNAIRSKLVLVIDGETNSKLGVMPTYEAISLASGRGLNLVQMAPPTNGNPPTCKILDYGKFKYDESKKSKAAAKKQRESQVEEKEITFKPDTAINDLRIKAKKACEFLDAGARVRVSIRCKGREASLLHVVMDNFKTFLDLIPKGVATPVNMPPEGGSVKVISFIVAYKPE